MQIALVDCETARDPEYNKVMRWILHGWPLKIDKEFKFFFQRRMELSTHKGCILWGTRAVIQTTLQANILNLLHANHPGMSVMKTLARSYVWWPKLNEHIEKAVRVCTQCQLNRPNPPSAPRQFIQEETNPWSTLHLDFAGPYKGHTFLNVVDEMSKWLEVKIVANQSSLEVISRLREIFAIHGLSKKVITDNGSAFVSEELKAFYRSNGITFSTTAPYHPSSNGQAERMVRYTKSSLATLSEGDFHLKLQRFLFKQHTTPHTTTGRTPAELIMGRKLRTMLDMLHPDNINLKDETREESFVAEKGRTFYVADAVFFRNYSAGPKWLKGIISEIKGPVLYIVRTLDDRIARRHVDQIRQRVESRTESELPIVVENELPVTDQTEDTNHPEPIPPVSPKAKTRSYTYHEDSKIKTNTTNDSTSETSSKTASPTHSES